MKAAMLEKGSVFEHIVACSETGTHVCLTMRTGQGELLVGVLRLEDEHFKTIFRIPSAAKMRITHCIFDRGRTPLKQAPEMWKDEIGESGRSLNSETVHPASKKRPNELQYVAFVVEKISLVEAYTLLVYSLEESCFLLQTPMPWKPEGLLFFQSPNSVSLISLAKGRRAMQHSLQVCEPLQLTEALNSCMDTDSRVLHATDFILTPSEDGRRLGYMSVAIKSSPQR
jgi:hypothetical protein